MGHVLIPSDIPDHSKQSTADVKTTNDVPKQTNLSSGNIGIGSKSAEFVGRSFSIVPLIHSLIHSTGQHSGFASIRRQ